MIHSMTGFGRGEAADSQYKVTVEMKSVNHRYLDISIRVPKKLGFLESAIRNQIKESVNRGKIDVYVNLETAQGENTSIEYDGQTAAAYHNALLEIGRSLGVRERITSCDIAAFPGVLSVKEAEFDEEQAQALVVEAVQSALVLFVESREMEGVRLRTDLLAKIDLLKETVEEIEKRSPQVVEEHRNKLREKVKELLGDTSLDEGVLATELIVYADKICVDEETVRLRTHFSHMEDTLEEGTNIGRKLDFITQEMNREANTILSKSGNIAISDCGIRLKTEIEKIREQIQNIE